LRDAIRTGLANREEALAYARGYGRGIDAETADRFVAMYVNDMTLEMGERGKRAVAEVLRRVGAAVEPDFVE
jgi:1,4-dihydroxy-6-naphthoate synthase